MQKQYEKLMRKCISLAKKYAGKTSPNPLVGAIIFDDNFNIISMGAHQKYGEYHAERNAILSTKEDLKGKNLIVNLIMSIDIQISISLYRHKKSANLTYLHF